MWPGRAGRGLIERSGCTGPEIQSPERKRTKKGENQAEVVASLRSSQHRVTITSENSG